MAKGLNRVQIIGNLGKDPEMKYTAGGKAVCSFSVAVNRAVKDGDGWKDETEWVRCVAWEKLAETCNQYLSKGSKIYAEGRLQTRSWEQDGATRYSTEVVLTEMIMLDGKGGDQNGNGSGPARGSQEVRSWTAPGGKQVAEVDDEDVPF